jgi:aspartyl-tRNA(Asn)/glutamyl-tRNA(Gln) amidotransferase subunit B
VEGAIAYEIERQKELLEKGEAVSQETRGWDEVRLKTFSQRSKETAKDYRYFPDPDIPKINTESYEYFNKTRLSEIMPELPSIKRIKYANIDLPSNQIELVISVQEIDKMFTELYAVYADKNNELLKLAANYLTSDVIALLGADDESARIVLSTEHFAELMEMVQAGSINSRVAKDLLSELLFLDGSPKAVASAKGLMQSSDPAALTGLVAEVITENPTVVAEYIAGKETSIQFLIGQAMKKSRGTANPGVLMPLLKEALEAAR